MRHAKKAGGLRVVAKAVADPKPAAPASTKRVYVFGNGDADGDATMKTLLGGKGANLAEMSSIGLSVPAGFTVTTETCAAFHENGGQLPEGCWEQMLEGLAHIEACMGAKLGDPANPLLLSVRSGAAISMPGMMDTVLNLGLNDTVVEGLAEKAGEQFAFDSYRRFLDMYGDVVMGIEHHLFEHEIDALKKEVGVLNDNELSAENLRELVKRYKKVYETAGRMFPQEPVEQMKLAAYAVFDSWNSDRAKKYMAINQITGLKGTAVTVQSMVFGNMGETSGTGVCFTRNPSTGENLLYGEYLVNAQGEDVVAGIRTPQDILTMKEALPAAYDELVRNTQLLEKHYKDMQDIEFTVQEGKLYMLQTRAGKRTGAGAVKIACDLVADGMIDRKQAVQIVEPTHIDQLLHPQFKDEVSADGRRVGRHRSSRGTKRTRRQCLSALPPSRAGPRAKYSRPCPKQLSQPGMDLFSFFPLLDFFAMTPPSLSLPISMSETEFNTRLICVSRGGGKYPVF